MSRVLILSLGLLFGSNLFAQEKTEREYRVDQKEVPIKAVQWINHNLKDVSKIKWFYEQSTGKSSYEAKLRKSKTQFSIEFDTLGIIEDIEQRYDWKKIDNLTRITIEKYFTTTYKKHQVIKIQKQFVGDSQELSALMLNDDQTGVEVNYEIEFHGKTETENELWEGLFNEKGELLQLRRIQQKPKTNLEF
ncbi:MAG: hypothetical protein KQH79_13910 [Bacteroidetes bacterium]|nr:hypothetical protein [Bacteroidota bacterium]